MRLNEGIHLGYCTNIHRGETWDETFHGLDSYATEVRRRVCAEDEPWALGLRLSRAALDELRDDAKKSSAFTNWLEKHHMYLFTINGFPYGKFHGGRVKEQVYAPDWTSPDRLDYTNGLFDFLCEAAPADQEISVSTLPGSFKEFIDPKTEDEQMTAITAHLRSCSRHIDRLREKTGRDIHLGLEPEPLGLFENTAETIAFFDRLTNGLNKSDRESILRNLGVNYDTCHFAVEFESADESLSALRQSGIRISKIHLSSALSLRPGQESVEKLAAFDDEVYLHQTIVAGRGRKVLHRFKDIPEVLDWFEGSPEDPGEEWRVHFHIPLHAKPAEGFGDTRDQISGVLREWQKTPDFCRHVEMETYTWEVLPDEMKSRDVVEQLIKEYQWTLDEFRAAGLA